MPVIGITTSKTAKAVRYKRAIERVGGAPVLLRPKSNVSLDAVLDSIDGLVLSGGEDIDPAYYDDPPQNSTPDMERDAFELPLITSALDRDMPILGICRGMEAINVSLGGKLKQHIDGHRTKGKRESAYHDVYVAPGSRLGAILGGGPIMRVNSRHHQGFTQPIKAPALLASAYALEGDVIEGIEAPLYSWVIGVQWHPEREAEVHPKNMNLFSALVEAARRAVTRAR
ncbi:MAG: gamma-glutamyl-gamma-aminobutyrate hydrolase family protein [Dehalococcoidia bacterium]